MALKKILLAAAIIVSIITPVAVFADVWGLGDAARGTDLIGSNRVVDAQKSVPELIGSIVAVALSFVGVVFFLLILYAGLTWMTAFGNTEKVDRAKSIVEHAAIGLIIVLAAYAISRFVFTTLITVGNNPTQPTNTSST